MFISIHIFSIHASLVGCNRFLHLQTDFSQFQFMHPIRDATMSPIRLRISRSISIHASRNGCNFKNKKLFHIYRYFNSCTPSGVQQQSIVFIFPFILYFVYVILCLIFLYNHIYINFLFYFIIIGANLSGFLCILKIRTNYII